MVANATTIVMPTDEQLVAKAPVIVEGTVLSSEAVDRDGRIWTETTVAVARTLKGDAQATIIVRELGGVVGDRFSKVFGTPEFTEGERVLLFLDRNPRGGFRTVDLFVGKFSASETMNGRALWLRRDFASDATLLDENFRPLRQQNVQRDAARFETYVSERVAGRAGTKNYGVENPVLAKDVENLGKPSRGIESNFALIAEPTIYRWTRFDNNGQAAWYSGGTQPGYTGGGVTELQQGMTAWTSYSSAKILYTYAGTRAAPWGGLNTGNNVNEVLFNDPNNEITGSWDRTKGGVVGTGGFNGVSNQVNWTAPFAADAAHPAGVLRAWTITEGNLTIQDNVSLANGVTSKSLAEILAHEFGHTLGFGHSDDSTALMYYSVTGIGPSLRADDQLASRWLYPNGSNPNPNPNPNPTPTVPAAPGSLSATASGESIELTWVDQASNETGHSIYLASATGAFSKVGDLGANITRATITGLAAGTYRVYVVAFNTVGASTPSNTATVSIAATAPVAAFTATPAAGNVGTPFTFNSTSTGTIESLTWDFGDGATGSGAQASHTYTRVGTFTVTLTARGAGKSSIATKSVMVSGPLTASFVYSPANPQPNQVIQFSDQSTGGPASWSWNFGDGSTSTQQNPSKQYATAGNYTVTLMVFRNGEQAAGNRVVTVAAPIPVTPAVNAAFDMSTTNATVGTAVSFTDRSSGSPTSWNWNFGDGSTSNAQHPSHTYAAPGAYSVTLTASNAATTGSMSKQIVVSTVAAYRTLVSVATQTAGVGGTSWRTELNIFNAGTQGANINLIFLPTAGGSVLTRPIFLAPRQWTTYSNALLDLFGIGTGAGALAIEATSAGVSADLRVSSRTFTTGSSGTYGQSVPDVQPNELQQTLYVTGMAASSSFRTNVGIVNRSSVPLTSFLTLYDRNGATISTKTIGLAANSFQQSPLSSYFPELNGSTYEVLTMVLTAAAKDAVSAYASVVDNATQDPIYIQAVPAQSGGSLTIPIVGRAPGVNGTFWRSDVTLYNPSPATISLSLRYAGAQRTISLGGNDTMVLADVLSQFGQTAGNGTLQVAWTSVGGPVVTSRTYTSVATGGTFGQSIEPVASFASRVFVPGLRNDADYRSNIGFVNGGSEVEVVNVSLISQFGTELGRTTVTLQPNQVLQYGVTALFPNITVPPGFTLQADGDSNSRLFAYGSMVDNDSGDPVFFAGR
jgi:PKD repeat protein